MGYTITNLTDSSRNESPVHGDFLRYTFDNGTVIEKHFYNPEMPSEQIERDAKQWRNDELRSTDFIVPITDYPNHAAWLTYRERLRDWPSTDDFPETKPTKP